MAVYQENPDGTITTVVEDVTIGQLETRIKESLCLDSTCGAEIRSFVAKAAPAIKAPTPTEEI